VFDSRALCPVRDNAAQLWLFAHIAKLEDVHLLFGEDVGRRLWPAEERAVYAERNSLSVTSETISMLHIHRPIYAYKIDA
jgi:hypothetical protein